MKAPLYLFYASIVVWLAAWPRSVSAQTQFRTVDAFGDVTLTETVADRNEAATGSLAQAGSAQLIRGPYLQMATPSSAIVRWRTDLATDSRVRYGTDSANLALMVTDATPTNNHVVLVTNLSPETKYFYSVGSTSTVLAGSTSHFFVTAPPVGQARPVRLWAIGDSGTANANAQAVRNAYFNYADTGPIDVWLMLGDNAYNSGLDHEYQAAVFNMYPTLLRNTFLWPTIGNHDTAQSQSANSFPYLDIFTLPQAGEAGGVASGTEKYYSFDHANIHFICLDSSSSSRVSGSPMLTWLRSDLEATTQTWLIAYWHHPPYTKGSHNSDLETELIQMRENVVPLLEEFDVDLVLVGHSHSFERSFLLNGHYGFSYTLIPAMKIDPGGGREEGTGAYVKSSSNPNNNGAVYVVAGSSGLISGGPLNHPAMYISLNVLGSMVIDVSSNRLDAVFLGTAATALDHFTIIKDQPLSIQTPPVHVAVTEPNPATFSVAPNGTAPLTYQWRRGGANIAGATGSSYTLNPTSRASDNGAQFDVIVSNSSGAVTSTVAMLTVNAPGTVPANGLALWLRADAGTAGSTLAQWSDQSGNTRHATQSTGASQPLLVNAALNGLPVVRFDGINDFLTFTLPVNGLTGMSVFLVAANTQNQIAGPSQAERAALFWNEGAGWGTVYLTPFQSSVRMRFGNTQAGNQMAYTRPSSGSSFSLSTAIKNGTTDALYVNGAQVLSQGGKLGTIAGCLNTGNLGRGYNNDTFYAGDIAEVLVYTRALTAAERQTVEQYLDGKYALAAPPSPQPPSIQTQPANVVAIEPHPANFSVVAGGTEPLTYQWRRGGANISGATSSSYTVNPTSRASDNGAQFDVIVSNSSGAVTSTVAMLTVNAPGTVPANGLALWLRADAGAAGSSLSEWSDQSGNNRHAAQTTSARQPLLVNAALNGLPVVRFDGINDFLTFTLPVNGLTGMSIFLVAANTQNQIAGPSQAERAALFWNETAGWGTVFLTPFQSSVRMRFGTTQAGNQMAYTRPSSLGPGFSLSTAIKNGTTDALYINGTQVLSQGGKLGTIAGCLNTGNLGRGYNNDTFYAGDIAEVLIYTRALTAAERQTVEQYLDGKYALTAPPPPQPPVIQTQPANVVVIEPNPANFSVVAGGTAPLTYQWRRGGAYISGATSSSYTLNPSSRSSDNGAQFDVIVSNSSGAITSSVAMLTVNAPGTVPANGLALWLRADAGTAGSILTQWNDQSGNNRHATQSTSVSQPLLVNAALNGLPVVRFDGINDFLTFTLPVNGLTGMSIFLVAANTQSQIAGPSQAERAALFWNEGAGWGTVYLTPFQSSVRMRFGTTQAGNQMAYTRLSSVGSRFSLSAAIKNGTTDALYINGTQVLSQGGKLGTIAGCLNTGNLGRGYNNDTFFAGDIAEVLVYTQALTAAERQTVEQYLGNKYQLSGLAAQLYQASAHGPVEDLRLTIEYETNELLISWPLSCLGCVLQQAPNLQEPVAWTDVMSPVRLRNHRYCAVVPVGSANTFYRLREP